MNLFELIFIFKSFLVMNFQYSSNLFPKQVKKTKRQKENNYC